MGSTTAHIQRHKLGIIVLLVATIFATITGILIGLPSNKALAATGTCTWTGGGSNENFSNSDNWSGCDGDGIPENGDTLAFPTSVDSDTNDDDDRQLNNDISNLSVAGLSVTGEYAEDDWDYYKISGNSLTLTGNITGGDRSLRLDLDLVAASDITISSVVSEGDLTAGSNDIELLDSRFDGGLTGSGKLTIDTAGGGGGAGGSCSNTAESNPFSGDSSGFTGAIIINGDGLSISPSSGSLGRKASSIKVNGGSLGFGLNSGSNASFSNTPITMNGGEIFVSQRTCSESNTPRTMTISSNVTVNNNTDVYLYKANLKLTGKVTGASKLKLPSGINSSWKLIIGSKTQVSKTQTTTYKSKDGNDWVSAGANQIAIIAKGAVANGASVYGGILKGIGKINNTLFMESGKVAPGLSPGCLTSGGISFTGGTLEIELAGSKACSNYDQLVVKGVVDLGSKTKLDLKLLNSYLPTKDSKFTIIKNDGSDKITGKFRSLPEGATFGHNGGLFKITYKGGTGNDVVLTVLRQPKAPDTGFETINTWLAPLFAVGATTVIAGGLYVMSKRESRHNA